MRRVPRDCILLAVLPANRVEARYAQEGLSRVAEGYDIS